MEGRNSLGQFSKGSKINLGRKMSEEKKKKIYSTFFKKGSTPWNKDKKMSSDFRAKLSISRLKSKNVIYNIGKDHHAWLGNKAKYQAKHIWLRKHHGKPKKCSNCLINGIQKNNRWTIQYACINHNYTHNHKDYIPLCAKCHRQYDKGKLLIKFI